MFGIWFQNWPVSISYFVNIFLLCRWCAYYSDNFLLVSRIFLDLWTWYTEYDIMIRDIRLQYSIYMMITGIIAIGENIIDDGVCFSSYPSCVMNVMREQYKNIYEQKQWLHVPGHYLKFMWRLSVLSSAEHHIKYESSLDENKCEKTMVFRRVCLTCRCYLYLRYMEIITLHWYVSGFSLYIKPRGGGERVVYIMKLITSHWDI